ncbi:unnamed protein product [Aureobasidium mustum]|uniref:THUMP domain-containing protein n=1 Tax=Aureobasidium mustum TaxID=2773714 RepID=A0A9N8JFX7_9PEZI|nr:unnamed protein product [Aureobasidium mustum]
MADASKKRAAPAGGADKSNKMILPGDQGIWATCDKGREGKCTGELRDLFNELAAEAGAAGSDDEGDGEINIEAEIQQELADIRKPQDKPLFWSIKLDVQCVIFFKTRAPVEPVSFVRRICEDAAKENAPKRTRFCNRLTPMTLMGKATEDGLEKTAKQVLAPHLHTEPRVPTKRMDIIQKVASMVGPGHQVDLKNPDVLILVEIYTIEAPKEQPVEIAQPKPDEKDETHVVKEEIDMPAGEAETEHSAVAAKDEAAEA